MKNLSNDELNNIKINPIKKINFFKRIQVAIFKVENYGEFVLEKTKISLEYFLKLVLLVAIVISIASTIQIHKIVNKGYNYLKNEMPDFYISEGKMHFIEDTEAFDKDFDIFILYRTSSDFSDSIIKDIEKEIQKYSISVVYFGDRVLLYNYGNYSYFKYSDLINEYNLNISNKQDLINVIDKVGIYGIDTTYFIASFLASYITEVISILFDVSLVFLFGIVVSRFCGVGLPAKKMFSLSIYSLTLSVLLSVVYNIANTFTNFYMEYFQIMYILIAYVYLIAAILIIKSDIIKQKIELEKIIEVQGQVRKELEEQKEKDNNLDDKDSDRKEKDENEKGKKDKKEKDEEPVLNREPDGSEI